MSLLGYPNVIPYTKFEHFCDHSIFSYAADKQTHKQRALNVIPTRRRHAAASLSLDTLKVGLLQRCSGWAT